MTSTILEDLEFIEMVSYTVPRLYDWWGALDDPIKVTPRYPAAKKPATLYRRNLPRTVHLSSFRGTNFSLGGSKK